MHLSNIQTNFVLVVVFLTHSVSILNLSHAIIHSYRLDIEKTISQRQYLFAHVRVNQLVMAGVININLTIV